VRKKVGKGYAYLLCTYAYPGHEKLKHISANIMRTLLDTYLPKNIYVRDTAKQVYWSNWKNGDCGKIYLLNIDWTKQGNTKSVEVVKDDLIFTCDVKERNVLEIAYQKQSAVYATEQQVNVIADTKNANSYEIVGFGTCALHIISSLKARVYIDEIEVATTAGTETVVNVELNGQSTLRLQEE
jgi:hypothetical protein